MTTKTKILIGAIAAVLIIGGGVLVFLALDRPPDAEEDTSRPSDDSTPVSSNENNSQTQGSSIEEDLIFKEESASIPDHIKQQPNYWDGPWHSAMYIATSEDGLEFENEKLFLEHSGVPNLITTSDGKLIATFQYFSFQNQELFDVISYSVSEDNGTTWSPVRRVEINGLDAGDANMRPSDTPNACDPTLVELEDGTFRLYFTHHPQGSQVPQMYSAKADSIDSIFESEGPQLDADLAVLDPAVVNFKGTWHHYTTYHESMDLENEEPEEGGLERSVHSTSDTGLNFTRQDDILMEMSFLGDVIEVDGQLRFYGGEHSAVSDDGFTWTMEEGSRVEGSDPGVAQLSDGSFVIIYTAVGQPMTHAQLKN